MEWSQKSFTLPTPSRGLWIDKVAQGFSHHANIRRPVKVFPEGESRPKLFGREVSAMYIAFLPLEEIDFKHEASKCELFDLGRRMNRTVRFKLVSHQRQKRLGAQL